MAPDFIARIKADADGLEEQMTRQTEGAGASVNTNAAIEKTLGNVDDPVERLDVLMGNKYRNDPAKLAAWKSAQHLERSSRAKRKDEPTPTPPGQQ